MNMKDTLQVSHWLRSGATWNDVMQASRYGLVENERFTERAREVYTWLWTWSAPRFHGRANDLQDAIYAQHGMKALQRRYARVNRIIAKLCK